MFLQSDKTEISGEPILPYSKSIANRLMLICKLINKDVPMSIISSCDDTLTMNNLLSLETDEINIGDSGTSMRFGLAFLAMQQGREVILSGSERMYKRPIGILVDAINTLGGDVSYMGEVGFPPLKIIGKKLRGGRLKIDSSVSSQYISALLLIAPYMKNGLVLEVDGISVSYPYIDMTLKIMGKFGVKNIGMSNNIIIRPSTYENTDFPFERDWSAASYFYELLALADKGNLFINGLYKDSIQGDAKQVEVWGSLGIETYFESEGIRISKKGKPIETFSYDFVNMPDLIPTFVVTLCCLGIDFDIKGCSTLKIKESDRLYALKDNMYKMGFNIEYTNDSIFGSCRGKSLNETVRINHYDDHRIAMSFAPIIIAGVVIEMLKPKCVTKSFPYFFEELKKIC